VFILSLKSHPAVHDRSVLIGSAKAK